MTIYNSIFVKKSVRTYKMESIGDSMLHSIESNYQEMPKLFLGIETELEIVDNTKKSASIALFGIKAPYYLLLYTEEADRCMMNAGYIMEQMSLCLCSKGLGSCFMGTPVINRKYSRKGEKKLACILAFGKAKGSPTRATSDFRRLEMNQLCIYKEKPHSWMNQILEAARLAPSSMNSQPWRFLIYDNKIHVFSRTSGFTGSKKLWEINFGILFSHMMVTAEELWLDLDLIRLENISQKTFKNSEYVLSAVLNL